MPGLLWDGLYRLVLASLTGIPHVLYDILPSVLRCLFNILPNLLLDGVYRLIR